ncbi:MAG: hypothetical protein J6T94_03265 [Bacteroidaceae bacterium]|nr:hypothetical protein [Bacteroidaceae bacterium]
MKRIFLLLSLCLAFASVGMAQTGSEDENQLSEKVDTITILKGTLGNKYSLDGRVLSLYQLGDVLKAGNKKAYRSYIGGYALGGLSAVFAGLGGYLLFAGGMDSLLGEEVNKNVFVVGGTCLAVSIGVVSIAEWRIKKSVQKYNEGLLNPAPSPSSDDVAINFGITPSGGLGFTLSF